MRPSDPTPHDENIIEHCSERLRALAIVIVVAITSFLLFFALTVPESSPAWKMFPTYTTVLSGGALVGALVYATTRLASLDLDSMYVLAYALMIALCFDVALYRHALPWAPGSGYREFSATGVVPILFGGLLPGPPRRFFVAALAGALMDPVALLCWVQLGNPLPPWHQFLMLSFTPLLGANIAFWIARTSRVLDELSVEKKKIGHYRLLEPMRTGDVGELWLARDARFHRDVALRIIRPSDPAAITWMTKTGRELSALIADIDAVACLASSHLVEVYDRGVSKDGTLFCALELLNGISLDRAVRTFGPMPAARVVHVLREVCDALADAHHQGIFHRDLRPTQVALCRYGKEHDFTKVIGMGMGALSDALLGEDAAAAAQEERAAFAAPERIASEAAESPAADVYALGCLAYWLLTGRRVFDAASPEEWAVAHASTVPPLPSRHAPFPVPPLLDRTIMGCLAKAPHERPANAKILSRQLEPIAATHPWRRTDAHAWWRQHGLRAAPTSGIDQNVTS